MDKIVPEDKYPLLNLRLTDLVAEQHRLGMYERARQSNSNGKITVAVETLLARYMWHEVGSIVQCCEGQVVLLLREGQLTRGFAERAKKNLETILTTSGLVYEMDVGIWKSKVHPYRQGVFSRWQPPEGIEISDIERG